MSARVTSWWKGCLQRLLLSRSGRHQGQGAGHRHRQAQHSGRHPLRRRAGEDGARITWGDDFIEAEQAPLHGVDMDMNHIPDAAMTIAVAALFAEGPTSIRNIYNWRVKETDRLHAMATELSKLGVEVEEGVTSSPSPRQRSSSMRPSIPTTTTASPCASRWWRCPIPPSPSMIRVVPPRPSRTTSTSWPASVSARDEPRPASLRACFFGLSRSATPPLHPRLAVLLKLARQDKKIPSLIM